MGTQAEELVKLLSGGNNIYIQTHDFPDPDAIAAAFGLQYFLKEKGMNAAIIYEGELQTNPVESMVKDLGIIMKSGEGLVPEEGDRFIIVDGCIGNKNVTRPSGTVAAVIDHHQGGYPDDVSFVDIRPDYGSSSTIVVSYLQEQNIEPTTQVATALAIGIHVDTGSFRRRTRAWDIEAFLFLTPKIDQDLLGAVLRNKIFQRDLLVYEKALQLVKIKDKFAFLHYPDECSQNLLGMLADFFLSIEEVEFVVLCAHSQQKIIFSVRSEHPGWNAGWMIKKALKGLGSGGGHKDMAGGVIKDASCFQAEQIYLRFKEQMER